MKRYYSLALWIAFLPAIPLEATTNIVLTTSITSYNCGLGLHTFEGAHRAELMNVEPVHMNKTWNMTGSLLRCGFLFDYPLGSICQQAGNTSTTHGFLCITKTDFVCENARIKARTFSNVVNYPDTIRTQSSPCYTPTYCEDPAFTEPEPLHPLVDR